MKQHLAESKRRLSSDYKSLYTLYHLSSFQKYREISQIIDTIILDIETLQFKPQALVLSALFSVLLLNLKILTPREMIKYEIDTSAVKDLSQQNIGLSGHLLRSSIDVTVRTLDEFVQIFSSFLQDSFDLAYSDLAPTLEYVCPYSGYIKMSMEANKTLSPGCLNVQTVHNTVSSIFLRHGFTQNLCLAITLSLKKL